MRLFELQSYISSTDILLLGMPPMAAIMTLIQDLFLRAKKMARNIELKSKFDPDKKMKVSDYNV